MSPAISLSVKSKTEIFFYEKEIIPIDTLTLCEKNYAAGRFLNEAKNSNRNSLCHTSAS